MAVPSRIKNTWKVHVSGFPSYTQSRELVRVFSSYGPVKVEKLNTKFAVLCFTNEDDAKQAVLDSSKLNIYGEFLAVRAYTIRDSMPLKREPPREYTKDRQKVPMVDPRLICMAGDFHQQLDSVLDAVRLTQEEVKALSELYVDLEWHLQKQWPGCVAMPFGSITTGLGIKGSDADCYIQVPPAYRHPAANFVNKAKKLLQQHPLVFSEVLAIPRANTPIVKFFHLPSYIYCDVTFKSPLGAQNSRLIAFLLHADPRLIPMAVVIKYWAKVHGLSGTGRLTNYALTMLIIFYLQQPEAVLPSVQWLQQDSANDIFVDNWNTGFMHSHDKLPKSNNTSSISELLGGFFKFYSEFDFSKLVVCPLTGHAVNKKQFEDIRSLSPVFDIYKRNVLEREILPLRFTTPFCVQDPIEQCHNVASPINSRLAYEIVAYLKFAAEAYDKEKEIGCARFLKILLLQKPKLPRKGCVDYRLFLYPHILERIESEDWKSVVREVMTQMFAMCKLLLIAEDNPIGGAKRLKEKYNGTVVRAIWKRKQFNKFYSLSDLDFITKQTRITEEILEVDKEVFQVKFQLILSYSSTAKNAVASVKLIEGDGSLFTEFGKFFVSNMQGWLMALLKPYFGQNDRSANHVNVSNREGEPIKKTDKNLAVSTSDTNASDNTNDKDTKITNDKGRYNTKNINDTNSNNTKTTNDTNDKDTKTTNDTNDKDTKTTNDTNDKDTEISNDTKDKDTKTTNDTNDKDTKTTNDTNDKDSKRTDDTKSDNAKDTNVEDTKRTTDTHNDDTKSTKTSTQ